MKAHEVFANWRMSTGKSQAKVGGELGISQAIMSKLERGKYDPPTELRKKIGHVTGLSLKWDNGKSETLVERVVAISEESVKAVEKPRETSIWVAQYQNESTYHFIASGLVEAAVKAIEKGGDIPVVSIKYVGLVDVT